MSDTSKPSMDDKHPGTRGMTWDDMGRLRVDAEGRLSWDGKLIQVQRRVTLTFWQGLATVIVTLGAASQDLLAGFDFGCRLSWFVTGCSK